MRVTMLSKCLHTILTWTENQRFQKPTSRGFDFDVQSNMMFVMHRKDSVCDASNGENLHIAVTIAFNHDACIIISS